MTQNTFKPAVPLHIPLMTLLMVALAASTMLALRHEPPTPRAGFAVAGDAIQATPYGSGAAIRNLLF